MTKPRRRSGALAIVAFATTSALALASRAQIDSSGFAADPQDQLQKQRALQEEQRAEQQGGLPPETFPGEQEPPGPPTGQPSGTPVRPPSGQPQAHAGGARPSGSTQSVAPGGQWISTPEWGTVWRPNPAPSGSSVAP